eukprot:scaffold16094_cov124-Isochrysis_galbana.AAC.4
MRSFRAVSRILGSTRTPTAAAPLVSRRPLPSPISSKLYDGGSGGKKAKFDTMRPMEQRLLQSRHAMAVDMTHPMAPVLMENAAPRTSLRLGMASVERAGEQSSTVRAPPCRARGTVLLFCFLPFLFTLGFPVLAHGFPR